MKKILLPLALLFSSSAMAIGYSDSAKIVSSSEIYKNIQMQRPYQYCYEVVTNPETHGDGSATNELFGGILGGVIGNQFGSGSGKDIATVAGALLGASIANDGEKVQNSANNTSHATTRQVCETRYRYETQKKFSHYLVKYNYKGIEHSYETRTKPSGNTINVRVLVRVAPENGRVYRR